MNESTIRLGDLEVRRLGFGAMRLPGKDVWGEPEDPPRARAVLKRVVELGSNVNAKQLAQALERTPIVAVQNLFNVGGGSSQLAQTSHAEVEDPEAVLAACEQHGIAYLPFFPLAAGSIAAPNPSLAAAATRH